METCSLCPRNCDVPRPTHTISGEIYGYCKSGMLPLVSRAAPHFFEEPIISGTHGSGTIFFSGCNLQCIYCQNYKISRGNYFKEITISRLREIYYELIQKGVHNINLVTPSHFVKTISKSLEEKLPVPLVYNTSGYDKIEALQLLDGKINIYLPDLKYSDSALAWSLSKSHDYIETAKSAIEYMAQKLGPPQFSEDGLLKQGVLIRHLVLPGNLLNTYGVIDWVSETFPSGEVLFSLMSQYTPSGEALPFRSLNRKLTSYEYNRAKHYLANSNISLGFVQKLSSANSVYVPIFDLSGV